MSPREAIRLRKMIGAMFLAAAVIVWAMAILMSPHQEPSTGDGVTHVSASVATFIRNSALGTLVLTILSGALLFWREKPRKSFEDIVVIGALAALAASSLYQMFWIESDVLEVESHGPILSDDI